MPSIQKLAERRNINLGLITKGVRTWQLCTTCGGWVEPKHAAYQRLPPGVYGGVLHPRGLWTHKGCEQGTLKWWRCLGRSVAGLEHLYNEESDERFKRWYAHLNEQPERRKNVVTAICENCAVEGLQIDPINKCEKCGRLACSHRFREGLCAPCFVAAKQASDGNGPQPIPAAQLFPTERAKKAAVEHPAGRTATRLPANEISAALNGISMEKAGGIAAANGLTAEWVGWLKKFAGNQGMARMQLNGALRRRRDKGTPLVLSSPAEEAVAAAETPDLRAQRERAFAAHKAKGGSKRGAKKK